MYTFLLSEKKTNEYVIKSQYNMFKIFKKNFRLRACILLSLMKLVIM